MRHDSGDDNDLDEVVVADDAASESDTDLIGRAPTRPMRRGSLEIDFADPEAVAEFLDVMSKLIRTRRKIRIILE